MALCNRIWLLLRSERGQGAVDYALLSMVVALAAVTAVHSLAANVNHAFLTTNRAVNSVIAACLGHHG